MNQESQESAEPEGSDASTAASDSTRLDLQDDLQDEVQDEVQLVDKGVVKVCGFTRLADIEAAADAGVNLVGLNFVPSSSRCVDTTLAKVLAARAQQGELKVVGLFRNPTDSEICSALDFVPMDYVQLHGAELPEITAACEGKPVIKALSWTGRAEEQKLATEWQSVGSQLAAFLVDAYAPVEGGGTGRLARWDLLHPKPKPLDGIPLWLAGGLNPSNVARAIDQTRCVGVDTASGVEEGPGSKSASLMRDFCRESRRQFDALR
ncbi:MAG: phosphoribosylanthranilate isomerase [Pirellulaceae bacterium]